MPIIKRTFLTALGLACGVAAFASPAIADANVTLVNPAAAGDSVDFSLHLPLRNTAELDGLIENQSSPHSPLYHHWLTPAQFRARYGPDAAHVAAVLGALRAAGLQAAQTSSQMISVHGSAPAVERLLATKLSRVTSATGRTRVAAVTPYMLPAVLAQTGAVALNLHAGTPLRPLARQVPTGRNVSPQNRYSAEGGYWADDLKQAYQFPAYQTANGAGVSIAIIDGGDFSDSDLALFLQHERIGSLRSDLAPAPKTYHMLLPGAHAFSSTSNDSFEANLDAQQIAMMAPGATLTAFITADDTDGSFTDAYTRMIESNAYDIVSTSYGQCELFYSAAYNHGVDYTGIVTSTNDLFKQGNSQGMTFVTSSGDEGALGCPEPGYLINPPTKPQTVYKSLLGVSALADLPNTIAVGGGDLTTSHTAGSLRSVYAHEQSVVAPLPIGDPYGTGNLVTSNFAAGGGVSTIFPRPAYQKLVNTGTTMRAVPDVGGHIGAYTATGSFDAEYFAGKLTGVLGTSASAPDFAALLALKAQSQHSRLGLELPDIYELSAHNGELGYYYFHQSNSGSDGYYGYSRAHQGYNFIYGVGSPHGANFALLPFSAFAGDPQTATNP